MRGACPPCGRVRPPLPGLMTPPQHIRTFKAACVATTGRTERDMDIELTYDGTVGQRD